MPQDMSRPRRRLMYRLAARCPRCGRPPADLIPAPELSRYREDHPQWIVRSVVCTTPGCGARYLIRARDYQEATPHLEPAGVARDDENLLC